jgi:ATP-dependent exoDNAse (exonuclease V) beta subunit
MSGSPRASASCGPSSPVGSTCLIEAEASLRISEGERAERLRDNTRRLYMAMTRAQSLLYVGAGRIRRPAPT